MKRNSYAPFGESFASTVIDGTGYTGHVMDQATGLTYMQARYYDPQIGRFLSADPAAAGFNLYNYANNNPYRFTDPDGRVPLGGGSVENRSGSNGGMDFTMSSSSGLVGKVKQVVTREAIRAIARLATAVKGAIANRVEHVKAQVSSQDVVVAGGVTGIAGAPIKGNALTTPAVQVMGNLSVVLNLSKGQIGVQANGAAMTGLGGGAAVNPEVSAGLSRGSLQSGISQSNTAYAQVTAVTATGVPVDLGASVNWSDGGQSTSVGVRGGVGSYIGAGGGRVLTGTLVTPPLWGDGN